MNEIESDQLDNSPLSNGAGAAALVSAGLGAFIMAVLAILADHLPAFKKLMIFYTPTGPLSGVTTTAVVVWLACSIGLDLVWRRRNVAAWTIYLGLSLLAVSFLLMFPPLGDLF
jgi:hypothetical protein